jgi:hypothetical protein
MEKIFIEGTSKTPTVTTDAEQGIIEIKGRSNPENSMQFYRPLIEWIDEYSKNPSDRTVINIQLEHFNTSTSKCILDLFKKLEILQNDNHNVEVNWHYEIDDEDIMEAGDVYRTMTNIPIRLVEL